MELWRFGIPYPRHGIYWDLAVAWYEPQGGLDRMGCDGMGWEGKVRMGWRDVAGCAIVVVMHCSIVP